MTKMKLILFIAAMCCLLSLLVYSQEPTRPGVQEPGSKLKLFEAEIDYRMQELELKMSELEVIVAKVELEKSELRLKAAQDQGDSHTIAMAQLELKQVRTSVDMHLTRSEMARLRIELAKARFQLRRAALKEKPSAND